MEFLREGKVRDIYDLGDRLLLVTTDRISAFDRVLGHIPHKGQVLTGLSKFWFEQTSHIARNHLLEVPHPNVMVVHKAKPLSIEVVVRGYITGVTDTSIWGSYARGERVIYGIRFPDGLRKNQKLTSPVITPTTKEESGMHDRRVTHEEIISQELAPQEIYSQIERIALELFSFGQKLCAERGLILVDTKYEFGLSDGELFLIDELHTPDSSRFWVAATYEERFQAGLEPENLDKEVLRKWLVGQGYRGEGAPPSLSSEIVEKVSRIYIEAYERITGEKFIPAKESPKQFLERYLKREKSKMKVIIIAGSIKDRKHVRKIEGHLKSFGIPHQVQICSAHKTPRRLLEMVERYNSEEEATIFIAVAGRSNALGGMIDGATPFPVINCPPPSNKFAGLDLLSSLRMPSGIAPATVLEPDQAALFCAKIFGLLEKRFATEVNALRTRMREEIERRDQDVQRKG